MSSEVRHSSDVFGQIYSDLQDVLNKYAGMDIPAMGVIGVLELLKYDAIKNLDDEGDNDVF